MVCKKVARSNYIIYYYNILQVNLKHKVESLPGRLYADMSHLLPHLTVGQKQLLCLARVLLKTNPKILIIEETMDNVDPRYDCSPNTLVCLRLFPILFHVCQQCAQPSSHPILPSSLGYLDVDRHGIQFSNLDQYRMVKFTELNISEFVFEFQFYKLLLKDL